MSQSDVLFISDPAPSEPVTQHADVTLKAQIHLVKRLSLRPQLIDE